MNRAAFYAALRSNLFDRSIAAFRNLSVSAKVTPSGGRFEGPVLMLEQ
jgi:hypothetical protein